MVRQYGWESVKNANEIRAYIKTCAWLDRGVSMDIYADIHAVNGSNEMSFSTTRRWIRKFSAGVESVKNALKSGRPKTASSPSIVEKIKHIVKSDTRYTSQVIADMAGFSKASVLGILWNIVKLRWKVLGESHICSWRSKKCRCLDGMQTFEKVSMIGSEKIYECSDRWWVLDTFLRTTPKN